MEREKGRKFCIFLASVILCFSFIQGKGQVKNKNLNDDVRVILKLFENPEASYKQIQKAIHQLEKKYWNVKGLKAPKILKRIFNDQVANLSAEDKRDFKPHRAFTEMRDYRNRHRNVHIRVPKRFQKGPQGPHGLQGRAANWTEMGPWDIDHVTSHWCPGIGRIDVIQEDPNNSNILYAGAPTGGLWKSLDAGNSWTPLTDDLPVVGIAGIAIDPNDSNTIYIATGDKDTYWYVYSIGVLKSTDGGSTWATTGLTWENIDYATISKLIHHPTQSGTVFAGTNSGLYKTTDGGSNWNVVLAGDVDDIEFKPGAPSTMYAITEQFFRSTDNGDNFSQVSVTGSGRAQIAVTPANANYVYFSSASGIYRSTNSGSSFSRQGNYPGPNTQVWYDTCLAVSPNNAEEVYLGEIEVYKSANGGRSFSDITYWVYPPSGKLFVHADIHELIFFGSTLYIGTDGGIYKTSDGGASVTDLTAGIGNRQFYRIGCSKTAADCIIGGSQDNGTSYMYNGIWYEWLGADGFECLVDWGQTDNRTVVGSIQNGGGPYYSSDAASSYTTKTSWGTGDWLTPYCQSPTHSSTFYAGVDQVKRSTNGMSSWSTISSLGSGSKNNYIDALAVASGNTNYIYASKDSTIWVTTDGGGTWSDISAGLPGLTITYVTVSHQNPAKAALSLYSFTVGEKVYLTTDAGGSWTNISGDLPNMRANCVLFCDGAEDGLYVGLDVGIYYRDDNQTAWVPYFDGLPNVVIKELEIFYPTGKLRAATFGRGLWEADLYDPDVIIDPTPPLASFSASSTSIAEGDAINFNDESTGLPTSWAWSFEGALPLTSSSENPANIQYNFIGSYDVTLQVANDLGSDVKILQEYIVVSEAAPANYCGADHSTENEAITLVSLGTINKTSGWASNNDFTSESTDLEIGSSYPMTVDCNYTWASGSGCGIWIDWNRDGDFGDADEVVYTISLATDPYTTTVTVPAHASSGATRMRVRLVWSVTPDPCGSMVSGEVEDYTVNITTPLPNAPVADFSGNTLNIVRGDSVQFTDSSTNDPTSFSWTFESGSPSTSTSQNPAVSYAVMGAFDVSLTSANAGGSDTEVKVDYISVAEPKEDFLGNFATMGVWQRNSDSGDWNRMTPEDALQITTGDLDGDNLDDLIGVWSFGIFVQYADDSWEKILNSDDLVWLSTGDFDGDGRDDLVGSWTFGVWLRDSATQAWTRLHTTSASMVSAGDFDGDGKADLLGVWDVGIWVYYATGTWEKILDSTDLVWITVGDMNGDGRQDILGSWTHGVWFRDSISAGWTKLYSSALRVAAGDLNLDGTDDLIGIWSGVPGTWVRYNATTWERLNTLDAQGITAGKLR